MSDAYALGIHGVDINVEFEENLHRIRRTGTGTYVQQEPNTDNWFHFAIPTPSIMADYNVFWLKKAYFSADLNENARIELIHLRSGEELRTERKVRLSDRKVINESIGQASNRSVYPISLSIYVKFLSGSPRGEIVFRHAGAEFEFD